MGQSFPKIWTDIQTTDLLPPLEGGLYGISESLEEMEALGCDQMVKDAPLTEESEMDHSRKSCSGAF